MLEELFSFTGGIAVIITALIFYIIFKVFLKAKPRKEVLLLRPRDRRGEALPVTQETDRSLKCGKSNPIHRFIKVGAGYVFNIGGTMVTRFFGIEGSAFTATLGSGLMKGTIPDYLREVWGKEQYEKIPLDMRSPLESGKIGIIIEPEPISGKEHGLPDLTSDEVDDESDHVMLSRIAAAQAPSTKREFYQMLVGIAIGFGAAAILLRLGWF